MKKIIFASLVPNVGKTSLTIALSKNTKKKIAYMKPLGDRMRYSHKKLWDYDADLIQSTLKMEVEPQDMTLGFEHSKLRYMYDEYTLKEKLNNQIEEFEKNHDVLIIEGANYLTHGASIGMSALRLAKLTEAELVIILRGNADTIMDELTFIKYNIVETGVNFKGVILNQIHDMEDIKSEEVCDTIKKLGIKVFGIIPYESNLKTLLLKQIADDLLATPLCAEHHVYKYIKNIYIGSMSLNEVMKKEYLSKKDKLLIVSGDRSDIIVASIETEASGIVLTNNIIPPNNIIANANEKNIPLLLTRDDTFTVAKKIDKMEALLFKSDEEKFNIFAKLVKQHVDTKALLE